jgi:DNA modification methylase
MTFTEQLQLFTVETTPDPAPLRNNGSSFNDPAFAGNKTLPIHRWVPWIAGFSSAFVKDVLERYLDGTGTVLDPFCGVGTTLVEAVLLGHQAIGFEINPYAVLASRLKANAYRVSVAILNEELLNFRAFYNEKAFSAYTPKSTAPPGFRTRSPFYSPAVLRKVLILQDFITGIVDADVKDLFRLAFAATMVRYSNYSYEPSLGRRVSAGKKEIIDFPVGQTMLNKLTAMVEDITWLHTYLSSEPSSARIINGSFFAYHGNLSPESVDLIVTSPPYLNNYHYNRNTRTQLYWLGYADSPKDLKPLAQSNFGKYWQTVRNQERLDLEFSLPDSDLAGQLAELRMRNPEKGVYGGNGWANYAAAYFNDCYKFSLGMRYVLKPGGRAVIVIGNSILQGLLVPTDRYLGEIAESVGLELVRIDVPRATRVGNSIIQSTVRVTRAQPAHQLYEAVVELKKR